MLEENQAEGDVLVIGWFEVLAELVGGLKKLRLKAKGGAVAAAAFGGGLRRLHGGGGRGGGGGSSFISPQY